MIGIVSEVLWVVVVAERLKILQVSRDSSTRLVVTRMSMIGLAARPGTLVEPTCRVRRKHHQ